MNENIDLTKILEGLEGIELWSPILGKCKLGQIGLNEMYPYPILIENDEEEECVSKKGMLYNNVDGECIVFPSKDQRDWSKFVRPIKEGDPMMCRDVTTCAWTLCRYKGFKDGRHYAEYIKNSQERYDRDFNYMIRFKDFNPDDIAGSIEKNIQK